MLNNHHDYSVSRSTTYHIVIAGIEIMISTSLSNMQSDDSLPSSVSYLCHVYDVQKMHSWKGPAGKYCISFGMQNILVSPRVN